MKKRIMLERIRINNKKGFELTISTIILLALGIMLLIALTLVFTGGWSNFMNHLRGYEMHDMDRIINECTMACNSGLEYSFCCNERQLDDEKVTCFDLVEKGIIDCYIDCNEIDCG